MDAEDWSTRLPFTFCHRWSAAETANDPRGCSDRPQVIESTVTESPAAHRRRVEQKGEIVRFTLGCMVERNEEVERQPKETRELSAVNRLIRGGGK